MYKIAVMGDIDSIYGFAALGIETFPVVAQSEAAVKLKHLAENEYSIIYVTEFIYSSIKSEIDVYLEQTIPAIIPIPGILNNTSIGIENLKEHVKKAVGSDIIFTEQ